MRLSKNSKRNVKNGQSHRINNSSGITCFYSQTFFLFSITLWLFLQALNRVQKQKKLRWYQKHRQLCFSVDFEAICIWSYRLLIKAVILMKSKISDCTLVATTENVTVLKILNCEENFIFYIFLRDFGN